MYLTEAVHTDRCAHLAYQTQPIPEPTRKPDHYHSYLYNETKILPAQQVCVLITTHMMSYFKLPAAKKYRVV